MVINISHHTMNKKPLVFSSWTSRGIKVIGDLYDNSGMLSFQQLMTRFGVPQSSFYFYLQVRSALNSCKVPIRGKLPTHPLRLLIDSLSHRGQRFVSAIYGKLSKECNDLPIMRMWERDFQLGDEAISWSNVWQNISKSSRNPGHQLIHYKLCHRMYYTPITRFRMKLIQSPICDKCQHNELGTYKHMIWECPPVQDFWNRVTRTLSEMLATPIPVDPVLLLLGDDSNVDLTTGKL